MYRLVELLYKYKRFFLFALLELFCFILIVRNNSYQSASYYTSANAVTGTVMSFPNAIAGYFSLSKENDVLAEENALLRVQLEALKFSRVEGELAKLPSPDTNFQFTPAKVINNSINREDNYLTLNRGTKHGLEVGMGVISTNGVVGRIVSVSENYASVMSVLHTKLRVSASVKGTHILGSAHWDSQNPEHTNFEFVPRHETVAVGDTVVTSGYNSVYPEGVKMGIVVTSNLPSHAAFHEIRLQFTNDFNALDYVYVVNNKRKVERQRIEEANNEQ